MEPASITAKPIQHGLRNEVIKSKKSLIPPEYPPHLFKLHTLAAFIAPRGSGKTNACAALAKEYIDHGVFNEIFIISPTYESNDALFILQVPRDHVYENATQGQYAIMAIEHRIVKAGKEWRDFEAYKACYKRWLRHEHTLKDEMILQQNEYREPPKMKKPCFLVIIDDMSCTDLYSTSNDNPLNNFVLRHRHHGQLGVSLFFLVQNFKHGIANFLRQNVQIFFLWPVNDAHLIEGIYQEFANICTFSQFLQIFAQATEDPHSFLTIEPFQEDPDKRFRKNFDTFLTIPFVSASQRLLEEYAHKKRRIG